VASIKVSDIKQLGGDVKQQLEIRGSLKGYNEFKKALKEADPKLRRAMDKEIRDILKPVVSIARASVPAQPLSGWRLGDDRTGPEKMPDWDQATVRKGITIKQGGKRSRGKSTQSAWKIQNASAAGVVFEVANKQRTKPSGGIFTKALTLYHGNPSRLIWSAWDKAGGEKKLSQDVLAVVKMFEGKLERELRAVKG
jgi:hypothetical protein